MPHKKPLLLFLITALVLALTCASRVLADSENGGSAPADPGESSEYGDENVVWESDSPRRTGGVFSFFRALPDGAGTGSFDPRATETYLPPVRDQGAEYGTCWTFSAIADAEIFGLKNGLLATSAADINLSEWHLDYFARHPSTDPLGGITGDYNTAKDYLTGGNIITATMTMACWRGPAGEAETSSQYENTSAAATLPDRYACGDELHLENAYWLPMATASDRNTVKDMIKADGAATLCFHYEDQYLYVSSDKTAACYYQNAETSTNHEVTIVGWNDSYPASNFANSPSGAAPGSAGAWLCRNSWGDELEGGYFWVSYYDASVTANKCAVYEFGSADNYDNNYQYDGSAVFDQRPWSGWGGGAYYANVFTAKANPDGGEQLDAVSTYTYYSGVPYTVTVYTGLLDPSNPSSGTLAYTGEGTFDSSGFHTVAIDPIALWEGETFAVVFNVEPSAGGNLTVPTCYTSSGWSSVNDVQAGQSFISANGSNWTDCAAPIPVSNAPANVRIKAYTDDIDQKVNVSYDACGGSLDAGAGELAFGIPCGDLPTPTRAGYTFQGWFTKAAGGTEISSDTVLKTSDSLSLYAHWLRGWTDGQFTDVSSADWYYENIRYCWQHDLFFGLTDTLFGTSQGATRGQVATVLYRMAGSPAVTGGSPFDDVPAGTYFTNAVTWAAANFIVFGSDDDNDGRCSFRPYANITRQDFLCLLYRYANWAGADVAGYENTSLGAFSDIDRIASWALAAEKWSVGAGLQTGSDGQLLPRTSITRAQVAAFLARYETNG